MSESGGGVKPDFFIVGQPKAGTSALFSFLKQHPDVGMCATKEPQFFCHDIQSQFFKLNGQERSLKNYLNLYAHCEGAKATGEASTAYLYSRVAANEIQKFNPEAKVIALFREPVEFLRTYHLQMQRTSVPIEDESDFLRALELESRRKMGLDIPIDCLDLQFLYYSERVRYAEQWQRFISAFPAENLKLILYDDFKLNNRAVYLDVLDFLELKRADEPEFKIINPKVKVRFRRVKQTTDRLLFPLKRRFKNQMPDQIFHLLRSMYRSVYFNKAPIDELSADSLLLLKKRFRNDVERFGELIGRDLLTEWDYLDL